MKTAFICAALAGAIVGAIAGCFGSLLLLTGAASLRSLEDLE